MKHHTSAELGNRPEPPRRRRLAARLVLLGMSAGVAVWSGHQVTWALLGRASAFWLLEWSGILALTVATLAGLHTKWLVAAAAIALLITLTQ